MHAQNTKKKNVYSVTTKLFSEFIVMEIVRSPLHASGLTIAFSLFLLPLSSASTVSILDIN